MREPMKPRPGKRAPKRRRTDPECEPEGDEPECEAEGDVPDIEDDSKNSENEDSEDDSEDDSNISDCEEWEEAYSEFENDDGEQDCDDEESDVDEGSDDDEPDEVDVGDIVSLPIWDGAEPWQMRDALDGEILGRWSGVGEPGSYHSWAAYCRMHQCQVMVSDRKKPKIELVRLWFQAGRAVPRGKEHKQAHKDLWPRPAAS